MVYTLSIDFLPYISLFFISLDALTLVFVSFHRVQIGKFGDSLRQVCLDDAAQIFEASCTKPTLLQMNDKVLLMRTLVLHHITVTSG